MSKSILSLLLISLLVLAFANSVLVRAEDGKQEEGNTGSQQQQQQHEEEDEAKSADDEDAYDLVPHKDVAVTAVFPDALDRRMKLGEPINIVLGFHNKADQVFNITGIGASLHNPFDLGYHIKNFTGRRVIGSPVGPGQQAAVEYTFTPDASLEPLVYHLSAWVLYNNSADQVFLHTFFNSTIELYDDGNFNAKTLFSSILVIAAIGLVSFILIQVNTSVQTGGSKKSAAASVERGTRSGNDGFDDLAIYKPAAKAKVAGGRKGGFSKKSGSKKSLNTDAGDDE